MPACVFAAVFLLAGTVAADPFSPRVQAAIKEAWSRTGNGMPRSIFSSARNREFGFIVYTDGTVSEIVSGDDRHLEFRSDSTKTVRATFHTHPNGGTQGLSPFDEEQARKTGTCIYVISHAGLAHSANCGATP